MNPRIAVALAEYERENEFTRQVLLPIEDRERFMPTAPPWPANGGYRWFKAPNVICLEKVRRLKAAGRIP